MKFIELSVVETTEKRRETAKCADQRELGRADVRQEAEAGIPGKFQALLGLALHASKRITARKQISKHVNTARGSGREIADGICGSERPLNQLLAHAHVLGPGNDENGERQIGVGPEPFQSAFLDKVVAESAEPEARFVVTKFRAGDHAKPDVAITRCSGVAVFQTDVGHSAHQQGQEICIRI